MWKKLKDLVKNVSTSSTKEGQGDEELQSIFSKKEALDVQFARKFTESGGQFLYCENESELLQNLKNIVEHENIEELICSNEHLQSYLKRVNINFSQRPSRTKEVSFIDCEYLIAFDGGVMISSHQTSGRKLDEFPDTFIVFAKTNQLIANISEALQKLKSVKGNNLPTNITSIRGKNMHNVSSTPNAKNIYLLLTE